MTLLQIILYQLISKEFMICKQNIGYFAYKITHT